MKNGLWVLILITNSFSLFSTSVKPFQHSTINSLTQVIDTNVVLPPAWVFGMLYGSYTNQQGTIERVDEIIKHDYPIDAYWIDSWFWSYANKGLGPAKYIDFVADTTDFPDRKKMWDYLQARNIKGGFWIWDCIMKTGNESAFNEFEKNGFFKRVYVETNSWHNSSTTTAMYESGNGKKGTTCGNIDFKNPKAVAYFEEKMKHFFDEGADFIKLDRTDDIQVCKVMFELTQEYGEETLGRGFLLSHSGNTSNNEYKKYPAKWTDDTRSDWNTKNPTKDFNSWVPGVAFQENIEMFTNPKLPTSNIPFLTNDMGGFDMGKTDKLDEELYIRWLQFSMFNPITEVFSQPENPTSNLAYKYSEKADRIFKYYSHLRLTLFPYIYSYAFQTRTRGQQMLEKIPGQLYEFMFGNELLVAPDYIQHADSVEIVFPKGKWINFYTNEEVIGAKKLKVPTSIDQIPLYVRQGSIIPMRPYAHSIESGSNDTLNVHIYPGENSEFTLIEDDGRSNDYLKGIYAETKLLLKSKTNGATLIIKPTVGYYRNMKTERIWRLIIHTKNKVKSISVNCKKTTILPVENGMATPYFKSDVSRKNNITINW